VWELIRDPEVLATALPSTQRLTKISETEFEGAMNLQIGPVAGVFAGKVLVTNEVPPESLTLTADGKGPPGFGKGVGKVQLIDPGDGTTLMKYEGDISVGGRLASVGQRNIETVGKSMVKQGLIALDQALEARIAARSTGRAMEYTPPTEAEFASAVAKDVAGELRDRAIATVEARPLLMIVPLAALLALVVLLLVKRLQKGQESQA
jgi:carbon monoxide dehydrogenase subunit G